ncbi:MAG: ribonuclease H-like domain-containing protein [Lachnospiraceae bacterium]|nr:ribonuclease H-like domain-containing protein [Lachnospiraceae bacterium]
MKTITRELPALESAYPLEQLGEKEDILFLDIETTGFAARSSSLYLIGCIYYRRDRFYLIQWFAEQPSEERAVLEAFFTFAASYRYLVHFNGNHFDIPYIEQKCAQYELPFGFEGFQGTDLYVRISPLKHFLKLPNCKQKTIETYLGINREDTLSGGELISVYLDYVKAPTEEAYHAMLLHNAEDIQGMVRLLPILSYVRLYQEGVRVVKVNANYYRDFHNVGRAELIMKLALPAPLPISVSNYAKGCFFSALEHNASLKVPLIDGELKYFYSNYRDYYYLPAEDTALHKSVSSFVDPEYRVAATAATCYTRKKSEYVPEWAPLFKPVFKSSYNAPDSYIELTDERRQDRDFFAAYATHVLQTMIENTTVS